MIKSKLGFSTIFALCIMLADLENKKMIDDAEIIKKTWTCGRSGANRLRAPTACRLNPSSSMMSPHRPAQMIT